MRRDTPFFGMAAFALLLAGCGEAPRQQMPAAAPADSSAHPADPVRPGIRFDPALLRPGDRVGGLVAESVAAQRTIVDSSYVGVAIFDGQAEITGRTMLHPDPDLQNVSVCFEADPPSAAMLPRWSQDERRPWFCFENETEARRELGAPSEGVPATIVIERFTIHRGLTDQVNSARLVRVIRD